MQKDNAKEKIPFSLIAVSISFFFMNFSSVIFFGCTPLLLLKLSYSSDRASVLEGTVEGFALIVRALTGIFSDFLGKRKIFLLSGVGSVTLSRFIITFSTSLPLSIGSRWLEKLGNGMQASPREALIADICPPHMRGAMYGVNKAAGMAGSMVGSFFMLYVFHSIEDLCAVPLAPMLFWANIVVFFSLIILAYGVKDPQKISNVREKARDFSGKIWCTLCRIMQDLCEFSPSFWKTLAVVFIFKFGYFSGNFLMTLLYESKVTFFGYAIQKNQGFSNAVFLIIQNLSCCVLSYPVGKISDKIDNRVVVACAFILMIISLVIFGFYGKTSMIYVGILLYGLQMSVQGALMALLMKNMPTHLYGTGFGIFFLFSGVSVILTNQVIMHKLKSLYGFSVAFKIVAVLVSIGLFFLPFIGTQEKKEHNKV